MKSKEGKGEVVDNKCTQKLISDQLRLTIQLTVLKQSSNDKLLENDAKT
jgi:hypothetical protein